MIMKRFNIEINYPIAINGEESVHLDSKVNVDILSQFDVLNWQRFRDVQLQLSDSKTSFTVTNNLTQQTIRLNLLADRRIDQIQFSLESDIEIMTKHKDFFGLFTRNSKDYIRFGSLNFSQAYAYLGLFLSEEIQSLETRYRFSLEKFIQAA